MPDLFSDRPPATVTAAGSAPGPRSRRDGRGAPAPRALRRLSGSLALAAIVGGLAATAATVRAQSALDLGAPSVMSQQGQRLKIAVPYASAPGERVPVLRFSVASVVADGGARAPAAADFVVSQPERGNVVYLQSREVVSASKVRLVLAVSGPAPQQVTLDLQVPPPMAAPAENAGSDESARPVTRAADAKAVRPKDKRREASGQPA